MQKKKEMNKKRKWYQGKYVCSLIGWSSNSITVKVDFMDGRNQWFLLQYICPIYSMRENIKLMQPLLQTNRLQDTLLSDITPVQCNICSTFGECVTNLLQSPKPLFSIVGGFQATQTRHAFLAWRTVDYGWICVHRALRVIVTVCEKWDP